MVTKMETKKFILERTGMKNLTFQGRVIGEESDYTAQNRGRWSNYTLYQTQGNKYVGQIEHISQWQGEYDTSEVFVADTLEELSEKMIDDIDYVPNELKNVFACAGYEFTDTID